MLLVGTVLDHDHLGAALLLQLLDGLAALADDQAHLRARDHDLDEVATTAAAASASSSATTAAAAHALVHVVHP